MNHRRTARRPWIVRHGPLTVHTVARTAGHAAALARRQAAAIGRAIPYQTDHETAGWHGVAVEPAPRRRRRRA